jgi:hypothetical protein
VVLSHERIHSLAYRLGGLLPDPSLLEDSDITLLIYDHFDQVSSHPSQRDCLEAALKSLLLA